MNNKNIWLVQLINFICYIMLQIVVGQAIITFNKAAACFVYIGFLLLLPFKKGKLIWQLLLGFGVGLFVDGLYNSLGVHAFSAVLLVYFRSFLLYLLFPAVTTSHTYYVRPTLKIMGIGKFSLYLFLHVVIYHITVFLLDACNGRFFFSNLPQLSLSILLGYFFIFCPLTLSGIVAHTPNK